MKHPNNWLLLVWIIAFVLIVLAVSMILSFLELDITFWGLMGWQSNVILGALLYHGWLRLLRRYVINNAAEVVSTKGDEK